MSETLMERTSRLLHSSEQTLPETYAALHANGSNITYYWLRKFSAGNFENPSVNKVEELYTHLSGDVLFEG